MVFHLIFRGVFRVGSPHTCKSYDISECAHSHVELLASTLSSSELSLPLGPSASVRHVHFKRYSSVVWICFFVSVTHCGSLYNKLPSTLCWRRCFPVPADRCDALCLEQNTVRANYTCFLWHLPAFLLWLTEDNGGLLWQGQQKPLSRLQKCPLGPQETTFLLPYLSTVELDQN